MLRHARHPEQVQKPLGDLSATTSSAQLELRATAGALSRTGDPEDDSLGPAPGLDRLPEELPPHETLAVLRLPAQDAWRDARRRYADVVLFHARPGARVPEWVGPLFVRSHRGSSVSQPAGRVPQRRNARSNRARILATARQELGRNPDITLEELARASGVVRRTLFGHFPGRAALLEALAEEAVEALREAMAAGAGAAEPAEQALAHFSLSMWPVGDRYRMLLALAHRDLGKARVAELLRPARLTVTAILERGQRDGVVHTHLPPEVLSAGLEAMTIALLEEVNTGALEDDGTRVAISTLVAAGVPEKQARAVVDEVASAPTSTAEAAADG